MAKIQKKLIERQLPFNLKYIYLGIERGNLIDGQFCTCDNCGKLITNMVKIVCKDNGKKYTIGTDCTETLSKAKALYNNGNSTDYYNDLYSYNIAARFVTEINAGCKITDSDLIFTKTITRKGKEINCYTNDLKKYFPEIVS